MADDVMNRRLIQEVTDKWWLVLLRGLATVFLGIFLIINTQITVTIIIFIFGIYWLILGVIELFRVVVFWLFCFLFGYGIWEKYWRHHETITHWSIYKYV